MVEKFFGLFSGVFSAVNGRVFLFFLFAATFLKFCEFMFLMISIMALLMPMFLRNLLPISGN